MKKLVGYLVSIVVLLMVVLFFGFNPLLKFVVETAGTQALGTQVTLSRAQVSPFTGQGEIGGLVVANPAGYTTANALTVDTIVIRLNPLSILYSGKVVVNELTIQAPVITFEGDLRQNNLKTLANTLKAKAYDNAGGATPPADASPTQPPAGGKGGLVKITDLWVKDGTVNITNEVLAGHALTADLGTIHIEGIGAEGGASQAEVVRQVVTPVIAAINQTVTSKISGLKDGINGFRDETKGTLESIKDRLRGLLN